MQAYPNMTPLHWTWQWYTHFVTGTTTKADEITRIFGTTTHLDASPRRGDMGHLPVAFGPGLRTTSCPGTGCSCSISNGSSASVSGRADFALPYWDYTSDDPAKRGIASATIPQPVDPLFGVLYRPDRTSLANSGQPIQK